MAAPLWYLIPTEVPYDVVWDILQGPGIYESPNLLSTVCAEESTARRELYARRRARDVRGARDARRPYISSPRKQGAVAVVEGASNCEWIFAAEALELYCRTNSL